MSNFVESSINETSLIKKFIDSNKDIHNQISSYPISETKKQYFINTFTDESEKKIITDLVNHVRHVSNEEFNNLIKELCDKYNEVKKENDVYILVYIPKMGSGSGGSLYNTKSSFYVTNIAGQYLRYDYIIDITETKTEMETYSSSLILKKDLILKKINDLKIETDKNIYLYFCDDCSYTGEQINKIKTDFMMPFEDSLLKMYTHFYCRFIIPFILNKKVFEEFLKISEITNLIKNFHINKRESKILLNNAINTVNIEKSEKSKLQKNEWDNALYDTLKLINLDIKSDIEFSKIYLIDIEPIKNILINNYVSDTLDILNKPENLSIKSSKNYGERNLIYFDHKFADGSSINQYIVYPIIENCDYPKLNRVECPPAGYRNINYKLNDIKIEFDETKTFLQLLQQYDNDTHSIKNKYLKYKKKYLILKDIINKK